MILGHHAGTIDLSIMDHLNFDIELAQLRPETALTTT
jgi:hypothetical protein